MTKTRSTSIDTIVTRCAVGLAVAGTVIIGWLVFVRSSSDDTKAAGVPITTVAASSTLESSTSVTETSTTFVPSPAVEVTTTLPEVIETTTLPPIAETTVAPQPPPPAPASVAAIPPLPEPEIYSGGGAHQVMSDPLPSGVAFADVSGAFTVATRLADLVSAGDWAGARSLLPNDPLTDAQLEYIYGPIERMSLLLIDAHPDGGGFSLLLGVVTNENGQSQTSERCFEWYADENAVDLQSERVLATYDGLFGSIALRNNPDETNKLLSGCVWS